MAAIIGGGCDRGKRPEVEVRVRRVLSRSESSGLGGDEVCVEVGLGTSS